MARSIFISYRRADSKAEARSICQRLESRFGKRSVFIDVDSIDPGRDFRMVLEEHLSKCSAMVVTIGPRWLELLNDPRLIEGDLSNDYVDMEITFALERGIPIIPVLVDGASMPSEIELPEGVNAIALRQAFSVRHDSFPRDMTALERELRKIIGLSMVTKALIASLVILVVGGLLIYGSQRYLNLRNVEGQFANSGNFACFGKAEYPESWRMNATCLPFGCNFGKLDRNTCLTVATKNSAKLVIHGITGTSRVNECWLQQSCGDLREHGEFVLFKRSR